MSAQSEIKMLVMRKYVSLKMRNPKALERELWDMSKRYVKADLLADWEIFKSNLGVFNAK